MTDEKMREEFEKHYGARGQRLNVAAWDSRFKVWQIAAAQSAETISRLEADNSRLSKILQRASTDEENSLRKQLAAAQADNVRLRDALKEIDEQLEIGFVTCDICGSQEDTKEFDCRADIAEALAQPISTNALETYVAKKIEASKNHKDDNDSITDTWRHGL